MNYKKITLVQIEYFLALARYLNFTEAAKNLYISCLLYTSIKFCPKQVLAIGEKVNSKGYEYIEQVNLESCISCAICARICPDGAIEVYK